MGQVTVNLNGHHYTIGCADGDEAAAEAIERLAARMESLAETLEAT